MTKWDSAAFRGRIKERGMTEGDFWQAMGHSSSFGARVFSGMSYLTTKDVLKACEILDIDADRIGEFFYSLTVTEEARRV